MRRPLAPSIPFCPYCRGRVKPMNDDPHEWYVCPRCGEIPIEDVEMVDAREVDQ